MPVNILSVFLSSFLLFQIQPLMGKLILPWFGGTTSVWSASLLFFMLVLTGGYGYAYWMIGLRDIKKQISIHSLLLLGSVWLLYTQGRVWPSPVTPEIDLGAVSFSQPVLQIFKILVRSIGIPYFMLSANISLVQAWYSEKNPDKSPYWLFAFSNSGSLIALITYPIWIEPIFALHMQGKIWAGAYMVFFVFSLLILYQRIAARMKLADRLAQIEKGKHLSGRLQILWVVLSGTASILLLTVTRQLTQDVAPIPLLWIIPLTIYLLSFIFAFSGEGRYHRPVFSFLLIGSSVGIVYDLLARVVDFKLEIGIYVVFLFAACMVMHGELYRLRPPAAHLTRFNLLVSVGGTLGAVIVNFVAPVIFSEYWDFYLGWVLVFVLLGGITLVIKTRELPDRWQFPFKSIIGSAAVAVMIFSMFMVNIIIGTRLFSGRNFYGVNTIIYNQVSQENVLVSGATLHGSQSVDPAESRTPTTYYSPDSGIGKLLRSQPRPHGNLRVGVLGLGVGTLAAYGQPADTFRFYEINPMVVGLAQGRGGYFSYLSDTSATIDVILGDARILLEDELIRGEKQDFDVLVVDTFSGDSIPIHLVTKEAFEVYLQHLDPSGVIAVHVSNIYIDVQPVLWQAGEYFDLHIGVVGSTERPNGENTGIDSTWIFLTANSELFTLPEIAESVNVLEDYQTDIRLWTDEYSNLLQVLR